MDQIGSLEARLCSPGEVVEVVVNNDCPDILSKEMERIQVEFKFYDEYNRLAEKTETKWTSLNGTLIS
ncbi:hypothetical protein pdam_00025508 [Pocillopora damicornis]|uniref:Uncharacterized protein n=1 Tax=Pocillopora damicornis TaxID=46731 RepID=A0A3M6USQ7_POCDA|nr:hypothetical protein pdam_00025508 [Pocillopora damicornis]